MIHALTSMGRLNVSRIDCFLAAGYDRNTPSVQALAAERIVRVMSEYSVDADTGRAGTSVLPEPSGRTERNMPPATPTDGDICAQPSMLRRRVESARVIVQAEPTADAQRDYQQAARARQKFWRDTCLDPGPGFAPSKTATRLYNEHGRLFFAPSCEQVQYILEALDAALPDWDAQFPQLFYQTLELNFPDLLRDRRRAFFPLQGMARA